MAMKKITKDQIDTIDASQIDGTLPNTKLPNIYMDDVKDVDAPNPNEGDILLYSAANKWESTLLSDIIDAASGGSGTPVIQPAGYTFIGEVMIQWGTATGASTFGFSFPIAFPNNVFSIQITPWSGYVAASNIAPSIMSYSLTGGSIYIDQSSPAVTFSFMAIGN